MCPNHQKVNGTWDIHIMGVANGADQQNSQDLGHIIPPWASVELGICYKVGFLKLGTIHISDQIILCYRRLPCALHVLSSVSGLY